MTQSTTRLDPVDLLRALAEPTRLEIVRMLKGGERCVCELTGALGAAQSRLSFHLKVLRDAGILVDRKEGRWVYYSLQEDVLEDLGRFIAEPELKESGRVCC